MAHPSPRSRSFAVGSFLSVMFWVMYLKENSLSFFICALSATGFLALLTIYSFVLNKHAK